MRLLGRLLILLFVLPALLGAALALWRGAQGWFGEEPAALERLDKADPSIAYGLDAQRWTSFPMPNHPELVRVVSHADVPPEATADPKAKWRYAIDYQLVDGRGAVLEEGTWQRRTSPITFRNLAGSKPVTAAFYGEGTDVPTAADATVLGLSAHPSASALRVRLQSADVPLTRVSLRVYAREPVAEHRVGVLWQRLNEDQRRRLAEGNVYPPALLNGEERENLLRNRWIPLGPSGVAGRDYAGRELFVVREVVGERVDAPAPPPGLLLDAAHVGTVPLPETGGVVELRFAPVRQPDGTPAATEGSARITWYGAKPGDRRSSAIGWSTARPPHQERFAGGLLEIAADAPVAVRAFLRDDPVKGVGSERELTPPAGSLRVFQSDPQTPLTFPILHADGAATPFQLAVRRVRLDPRVPPGPEPPQFRYQLAGEGGRVLEEGVITLSFIPSAYDRLAGNPVAELSEPALIHFDLPEPVRELRVQATEPLTFAASNRPPGTARRSMVPEDRFAEAEDADARALTWFPLRPAGWRDLLRTNHAPLITLQRRPPQEDEQILAGRYDWEEVTPQGPWLARDLLVPRAATLARPAALASIFTPLPADGTEAALTFVPPFAGAPIQPELLALREQGGPLSVKVELDGRSLAAPSVGAARAVVPLPPVPAGPHRVRAVGAGPARLFVNQAEPAEDSLIRRRAIRLPVGETVFDYVKRTPGDELLAAHLFAQPGASGRQNLSIAVEGGPGGAAGPYPSWTLRRRDYSVRVGPEPFDTPVLGSAQSVGAKRTLFLPLGTDLPPGTYRLRVRLESGPEAYLSLARTLPGFLPRRDIRQEASREGVGHAR
ncbi:hypothetical protein [Azospirillum sp. sgz302134]